MPREIVEVVLTPEQIAEEERLNAIAQANHEAELALKEEQRLKREEIKTIYASIQDPHLAAWKIGEGKNNPAEYLKEALDSLDKTKLVQLKSVYDQAVLELVDVKKEQEVFKVLKDLKTIPVKHRNNPIVVKYNQAQSALEIKLDDLLK